MNKKNIIPVYKNTMFILLIAAASIFLLFPACNISYEDFSGKLRNSLHPVKPPFSNIYHGSNYRFPQKSCTEPECHFRDLTGGNSGSPSCYSCHDNQWAVFSVSHTLNVNGRYHHYAVDNGNFPANCGIAGCHGDGTNLYTENFTGYNYRYACLSCHDPIPPPGHRVNKEGVLHHFNIGKAPLTYCYNILGCHGNPSTPDYPGPRCGTCHDSDTPTDD